MTGDLPVNDLTITARARSLTEYLRALARLAHAPTYDITRGETLWPRRWPDHPAVEVAAEEPLDDVGTVVAVARTQMPPRPLLPDVLRGLVTEPHQRLEAPELVDDLETQLLLRSNGPTAHEDTEPGEPSQAEPDMSAAGAVGADREFVQTALDDYIAGPFQAWRDLATPASEAIDLYHRLYDLRLQLEKQQATDELILGRGLLVGRFIRGSDEYVLRHPLVVARVRIDFESDSGRLRIVVNDTPELEVESLDVVVRGYALLESVAETYRSEQLWPTSVEVRPQVLDRIAHAIPDCEVTDNPSLAAVDDRPTVVDDTVLAVRRRPLHFDAFFESLIDRLERGVPDPWAAIVADQPELLAGELADGTGGADGGSGGWADIAGRMLAPDPLNRDQEAVVTKLARSVGVTVQGPPGTGKSYTIVQLTCHLLAHGLRVLICAEKPQPLRVIRDKMPPALEDLCVAVLGNTTELNAQLERSIDAITGHSDRIDIDSETDAMARLRARLDTVRSDRIQLREVQTQIRLAENRRITIDGREMTVPEVASWLSDREASASWIADAVPPDVPAPLSATQAGELWRLARAITPEDRIRAVGALPAIERLPIGSELEAVGAELRVLRNELADVAGVDWARVDVATDDDLQRLAEDLDGLAALCRNIASERLLSTLSTELQTGPTYVERWNQFVLNCRRIVASIATEQNWLSGHTVVIPDPLATDMNVEAVLGRIRQRLEQGKGLPRLREGDLRRLHEAVTIDGRPIIRVEDVDLVGCQLRLTRGRSELQQRWSGDLVPRGAPAWPDDGVAEHVVPSIIGKIDQLLQSGTAVEDVGLRGRKLLGWEAPKVLSAEEFATGADLVRTSARRRRERELTARIENWQNIVTESRERRCGRRSARPVPPHNRQQRRSGPRRGPCRSDSTRRVTQIGDLPRRTPRTSIRARTLV